MGLSIVSNVKAYSSLMAALALRLSEGPRFAEQRRIDRQIGLDVPKKSSETERLYFWATRILNEEQRQKAERYGSKVRAALFVLLLLGLVLGVGSSYVVFAYDGSAPVNILGVLLAFVFVPLLLLLLTLFVMLPSGMLQRLSFLRDLRDAMQVLSPGNIAAFIASRLPSRFAEQVESVYVETGRRQQLWGGVERYLILFAGQVFAVWYFLGVLSASMYQVVTSDLAFGWSTTLEMESSQLEEITKLIAVPWTGVAPHAVPREELLRISRFFRLGNGRLAAGENGQAVDPAVLGEWWPFLLLAIAVYGLFPRLLLYAFLRGKLRRVIIRSAPLLPGADIVLQSMNSAIVSTAERQQVGPQLGDAQGGNATALTAELPIGSCVLIRWAGSAAEQENLREQFRKEGLLVHEVYKAGGAVPLTEESRLPRLVSSVDSSHAILFVANAWEPPTAEMLDFLTELREEIGTGRSVFVFPFLTPDTSYSPAVWQRALARLQDPWTVLLDTFAKEEV